MTGFATRGKGMMMLLAILIQCTNVTDKTTESSQVCDGVARQRSIVIASRDKSSSTLMARQMTTCPTIVVWVECCEMDVWDV